MADHPDGPIDARKGVGDRLWPLFARFVQRPTLAFAPSQRLLGRLFDATVFLMEKRCRGVRTTDTRLGGVPGLRIEPDGGGAGQLLYLHGGGFTIGGTHSHRHMAAHIAKAAGCRLWLIDYRLAPQHPFPAAPEDVLAAYRALRDKGPVVVAGDSAGGCLALGLLHWAARADLPPPSALVLLSPIADLDLAQGGFQSRLETEMLIPARWGRRAVQAYLGAHDPTDPYASPLGAALPSAPPTLIQYAEGEALARDATRVAAALRASGGDVSHQSYVEVPHVWQLHAGRSASADHAIAQIAAFLRRQGEAEP